MALHPELRARLQRLDDGERRPSGEKGGLDSDVDLLLQQLEDLDSRSEALRQMDQKDQSRWRKDDESRAHSKGSVQEPLVHPLAAIGGSDRDGRARRKTPHFAQIQRTPSSAGARSGACCPLPPLLKASASAPCLTRKGQSLKALTADEGPF
ncbi:unnamed protein product [Durusdinium trenchii]|uniref:Uncharacterized protein n=2 Tax=Durusdinium trenchii TaxID=1381693 RepID=A0ABP0N1C0_9DINO